MFCGIVQGVGVVERVFKKERDVDFIINIGDLSVEDFTIGESIAINGVCLTVRKFEKSKNVMVSAGYETLKVTNLGLLEKGSEVNLESSLTLSRPIGGHMVQGHVADTAIIINKKKVGESYYFRFRVDKELKQYIVKKGYVAIDGMSITITEENKDWFEVMIIPHTLGVTIAQHYSVGSEVNIEVDILGRYIEKFIKGRVYEKQSS